VKILICVPAFGHQMNSQTAVSLIALTKELADRQIFGGCNAVSFPDLIDLRNIFLTLWFDRSDATHLLLVDADMQFEPQLVGDMLLADKPLVGCIYPKKRLPLSWVGSPLTPPAVPEDNLLELEYIGAGVMLIRRDAIEAMIAFGKVEIETDLTKTALAGLLEPQGAKRIIKGFDKLTNEEGRYLSEDFSFCHRYRQAGGKVYAVINHQVTHLGIYPFTGRYSDMYAMKEAAE
jgi:hypothetical protein